MKNKISVFMMVMILVFSCVKPRIYAEDITELKSDVTIEDITNETLVMKTSDKIENDEDTVDENTTSIAEDVEEKMSNNAYITIVPNADFVEVGNNVQFQIHFNLNGDKTSYSNVKLVIQLPEEVGSESIKFSQELSRLVIQGIEPEFNATEKKLTYAFDELVGGFDSAILLELETMNGASLNGVELNLLGNIEAQGIESVTEEAQVTLVANQNASLSNKLSGVLYENELQNSSSIRYLDEAVFAVGLSVNKFTTGSLALDKESLVSFSYTLADGLEYISDTSGKTPTKDGNTYTWLFNSNNNENDDYFFASNFEIKVKVIEDITWFTKVTNTAKATLKFVDQSEKTYTAQSVVQISPNFEYELPGFVGGSALTSIFSGPSDAFGNTGWINNDDISVTDGALLGWNLYLTPQGATSGQYGMNSYDVFFHPDENINIEKMYSGNFYYRPAAEYPANAPMDQEMYYSLSVKYTDSEDWERTKATIVPATYYSSEDLGIDPNRTVKTLWFHFHDNEVNVFANDVGFWLENSSTTVFGLPAGLSTTTMRIWTSVDEGYVGSVASNVGIAYSGWDHESHRIDIQSKNVPEELRSIYYASMNDAFESRLSTKTAQIVSAPEGISRYVKGNAYFTESNKNLVSSGENTLRIEITNDSASLRKLTGPFETYILLGQGVNVGDLSKINGGTAEVISNDYKGTGKTLMKIVFEVDSITISSKIIGLIPVTIDENAPYQIDVSLFGYLNEDFNVSDVSNTNGTFTVKEIDVNDLNQNGQASEEMFVIRNNYTYTNAYEYYGLLQTSADGVNYSNTLSLLKDSKAVMDLGVFNAQVTPISDLVMIGVLPSVGDTYVSNDVERDSKFAINLTGPIILPKEYEHSFDVYYSTSKEPKVSGVLDANTASHLRKLGTTNLIDDAPWLTAEEVMNFDEIRSYKIVMKSSVQPIRESELHFGIEVKIGNHSLTGDETIENRIAYSSFAVGINNASVFETQTVNFILEKDPVYSLNAKNVVMTLTEVESMISEGTFESYVEGQAFPVVMKNNEILEEADVLMTIVDRPNEFSVGVYTLEFSYDDGMSRKVLAKSKSTLTITDDNTTVPKEPNPIEPTPDVQPILPNTGIRTDSSTLSIGTTFVLMGMVFVLIHKKKNNEKTN